MISSRYNSIKNIASNTQKGFWRAQALAKLNKKIEKGQTQLIFLRDQLKKTIPNYFQLQITNLNQKNINKKKNDLYFHLKTNNNNDNFFITSIFKNNNDKYDINRILFPYIEEREIYNQINLLPFNIKNTRPRTGSERIFNRLKIEREINKKFENIMKERIHNLTLNENIHNYLQRFYKSKNKSKKAQKNKNIRLFNYNENNNINNNYNNINTNNNYINTYISTKSSYSALNTINHKPKRILSAIV